MSSIKHPRWSVRIALAGLCLSLGIGLLAIAGAPGSANATPAATVPSPYADKIGVCTRAFWLSADEGTALYRRLMSNGITTSREDFSWEHTEPTRGNWNWSRGDNMFTAASRTGMDVLVILDYSAPWTAMVPGNFQSLPQSASAYATYSAAVVRRYGPGGTFWTSHPELTPQPVRTVEVFNEPWGYWGWPGNPDPVHYARLSRAATEAVHAANPAVDVLISGDLLQARRDPYELRGWVDEVLDADPGLGQIIDGYSIHPYHMGGPNDVRSDPRWDYSKVAQIRRITMAHGSNKPFWITEIGYSTARNVEDGVSETTQARYVRESITRAFEDWPYVKRYYYYSYQRDSGDPNDAPGGMSLMRADGSTKPAWTTITNLLAPRTVTTPPPTTTPPTTTPPTTPPTTTPPTTTPPPGGAVLGPARLAVRVLGTVFYYDPAAA